MESVVNLDPKILMVLWIVSDSSILEIMSPDCRFPHWLNPQDGFIGGQ